MPNQRLPDIPWLRVTDVARNLNVSKMTIYRLIHEGDLRAYRVGRSYRIDPRDFLKYVRGTSTTHKEMLDGPEPGDV